MIRRVIAVAVVVLAWSSVAEAQIDYPPTSSTTAPPTSSTTGPPVSTTLPPVTTTRAGGGGGGTTTTPRATTTVKSVTTTLPPGVTTTVSLAATTSTTKASGLTAQAIPPIAKKQGGLLSFTGSTLIVPLLIVGLGLVLLGSELVAAARRRRHLGPTS